MENELMNLNFDQITVTQGSIEFPQYEQLRQRALDLAANIEMVELTDENVKVSKKLLAAVNKRLKDLEDKRIKIKKKLLEPYDLFESQVKEIVGIVKDADEVLRQQIRDLEEKERQDKKEYIRSIFMKRKNLYTLGDLISFDDFIQQKHLNKTQSIDSVENEMIAFLERTEKDVKALQKMPNLQDHLSAYLQSYDLALAIATVQQQEERMKAIQESKAIPTNTVIKTFTVYEEKDFLLVEMYMNNNNIKFTVKDGM